MPNNSPATQVRVTLRYALHQRANDRRTAVTSGAPNEYKSLVYKDVTAVPALAQSWLDLTQSRISAHVHPINRPTPSYNLHISAARPALLRIGTLPVGADEIIGTVVAGGAAGAQAVAFP